MKFVKKNKRYFNIGINGFIKIKTYKKKKKKVKDFIKISKIKKINKMLIIIIKY
jgi:hypothetical protein